jgi:hypothetical protein
MTALSPNSLASQAHFSAPPAMLATWRDLRGDLTYPARRS